MDKIWLALARETGFAAENLAIGVATLGKANYVQHAYYGQAFFALSIGMERSAKLALIIDYALKNNGNFPQNNVIKSYGHNLKKLLNKSDEIARRRGFKDRLPQENIHIAIINVLSEFASNITRYYNFDIEAWFKSVTKPILEKRYPLKQQKKHKQNAELIHRLIGESSIVRLHSETGNELNTIYDAALQTAKIDQAKPYTRMYVMQLFRFIAQLFTKLSYASYDLKLETIPHMSDFFKIFNNDDQYFKTRKTWSIYL